MNKYFGSFAMAMLVCTLVAGAASAQTAKPMFKALPPHNYAGTTRTSQPPANLAQWNGGWVHKNVRYSFTMVGSDPRKTNTTTTIPVFIIPVKMVYGAQNGNMTFDPTLSSNFGTMSAQTVLTTSPLFTSSVDFVQGGTDLGKTQYMDAYQRANFWKIAQSKSGYHILLGTPTILPTQSITVSASQGSVIPNPFGGSKKVGTYDIFAMDNFIQGVLAQFPQITPASLPIFVNYDIYLTEFGGCCIGGYHSANGVQPAAQTYAYTSMVDQGTGIFSQDTAAASHEIGEWLDDPFVDNSVPCNDNSILENGDPLVLHDFPYTVNGFTYHLQDLVFVNYFGAPPSLPVNNWLSFQNDEKSTCPGLP